ncbi:type II toxin-antitoxin system RelE/ParE family toxin [Limnohabitans sp. WS1]|uniref:type II toxin-antitoxin system RelE/ParE family toxin n=1 Tax=Limnohabitans sp. WS1 TaxID=1100726 RepID=UPI000D35136F|nr:hypothetical protein B9Z48_21200 [Limnohabitans sp. WS1]
MIWRFWTYVSASGRNDVQKSVDAYETYGRNKFERAVAHLAVSPKSQWDEPHGKKLKNEDPIYEIRYQAFNRQERALGFFDDDGGIFVIVLICYHKGRIYTPPNAIDTAHRRISQIRDHTATTAPLQIFGEDFPPHESQ